MDNKGYNADVPVSSILKSEAKQNRDNEVKENSSKFSGVKRSYSRGKSQLQNNKYTSSWFPPSGETMNEFVVISRVMMFHFNH